ncbi:MAG: hypothetical protein ACRDYY_02400 [Acidimicrobiales bacterium]
MGSKRETRRGSREVGVRPRLDVDGDVLVGDEMGGLAPGPGVAGLGERPIRGARRESTVCDRGVQRDEMADVDEPRPLTSETVSPARSKVRPARRVFLVTTTRRPPGRSSSWMAL